MKICRLLPFLVGILCVLATGCTSKRTIVNGLEEKEANEIIVFLASKGIDATKVKAKSEGAAGAAAISVWDVDVDEAHATDALAILNMNGLPRRRGQNLLGLFKQSGLVPSEMEEKVRFQAGLAEQIASTIRKIDGVLDADIQLSFPEEDPLNPGKKKGKVTASVYVKHQGVLDDPNTHLVTKIKRLVASSIIGLDYDDVTVISDRARFTDVALSQKPASLMEEEKQYAKVWSLVLATESVGRFRLIFFSFLLTILVLGLALAWVLWKVHPVVEDSGGLLSLLKTAPMTKPKKNVEDKAATPEKPPEIKSPDEKEVT